MTAIEQANERVTALLYILMRDHIVPGEMVKVIEIVGRIKGAKFTNPYLEAMAKDYAARILNE